MKKLMLSLMFAIILLAGVSAFDWTDSVQAYYKLDNSTGVVYDMTTNYPGSNQLATRGATGIINDAFNFTGSPAHVNISDIDIVGNTSISLWAKWTQAGSIGFLDKYGGAGTNPLAIRQQSNQSLYATVYNGSVGISALGGDYRDNAWHHIVATRDVDGNNITLYVDGAQVGTNTDSLATDLTNNVNYNIGRVSTGTAYFQGTIDEVGIWNRTLNPSEVSELYNSGAGLSYLVTSDTNLTSQLIFPTNNSVTNNETQDFIGTITPKIFNLTNATFYIWYDNGTLFNSSKQTLSGDVALNASYSIPGFATDNYYWNIFGCQGNGVGENCSFANNNFTLRWVPFEVENETYSSTSYETQNETIYINISTDESVSNIGAFLVYNGTSYAASHTCSASLCVIERTLDIPLLANQALGTENKSFHWQITLFGSFGTFTTNTTANEQNISNINFENGGAGVTAVTFNIKNETTRNAIASDFDATFNYYLGSGTVKESKNYSGSGASSYSFNINHNLTFFINSELFIENSSLSRYYQFRMEQYTNSTTLQSLFIPENSASQIIVEVKDQGLIPINNIQTKIYRFYPSSNEYDLVESQITDEFGQFTADLIGGDTRYKFEFYDANNTLLKTSDSITITCRSSFCILPFIIETENGFFDRYDEVSLFSYSLNFNNVTNTFTFSWDDQRQENSKVRFEVIRYRLNSSEIVCNSTSTTKVSAINCEVGSSDATYRSQIFRSVDNGNERRIAILNIKVGGAISTYGTEGLFWVFILLFTAIGLGAFNPTAGGILYAVGFIFMGVLGLISMPIPVFFANTIITLIFIWAVRT